ncbi:MAG: lysine--tRNA ligase [Candidatus Thorarchaeota archaeon]
MEKDVAYQHWIDALVNEIIDYWGNDASQINCSCGLSVSGLQHVGRLRGEVTLANTVMHQLRARGYQTRHTIVRYTSDEWKGKPGQLAQFSNAEDAKRYIGRRLVDVPDPLGELPSWVNRYWLDFGDYLNHFSRDAEPLSTHEIYTWSEMHEMVRFAVEHRESVRVLVNKYRARNPYPKGWIPIDVVCEQCGRISTTTVTAVDLDAYTAQYQCDTCKIKSSTSIETGKLSWRIEWAALWRVLNVGFEPFGKDHATPGGSRDSAKEIAESFFNFQPPVPYPYEWVGLIENGVDKGDMGSSDFNGFTPKIWISVAPGNILRYIFLKNKPMKRLTLGLEYVPNYINQYERAERIYYKIEKPRAPHQEVDDICRSFELANLDPLPKEIPLQIPYLHAVLLTQIIPSKNLPDAAIDKLATSEIIPSSLTKGQREAIITRLTQAQTWVENYAPDSYHIKTLDEPPLDLNTQIPSELRQLYLQLYNRLSPQKWTEHQITEEMKTLTKSLNKETQRAFFQFLYQAFFGRNQGPRISAYFAFSEPNLVRSRLQYLAMPPK